MKKHILAVCACCLFLVLASLLSCCGWRPASDGARADHIWVYGESALISAETDGVLTLEGEGESERITAVSGSGTCVDRGLLLWQLPPGEYRLFWDDEPLLAADNHLPEGYTLPRPDGRKHWVFGKDREGRLTLTVSQVSELPEGWYDVIVDAGHGGRDTGAEGGGYTEAELNLESAQKLAALLRGYGLTVTLTRDGPEVPGGAAAEDDPYADGARVDLIYASHAPYLLSCHLNASAEGAAEGFQIYCSVASSPDWAEAVADALREAGAIENNGGKGLLAHGVYQRGSQYSLEPRDYYFILRETGGNALSPEKYLARHRDKRRTLSTGAQGLLLEFAFMDNEADLRLWLDQRERWLSATAAACAEYWQLI